MSDAFVGYDIIGDVHGCADSLEALLCKLGYTRRNGSYEYHDQRKPRQVILLGDLLDRGPKIRESVLIAREMVERGSAQMIMGNHEYYALCYCTPAAEGSPHQYLREHTEVHNRLIAETIDQFANHPADWRDTLDWIYQMPLFLEFEQFRVVHACWDQSLIDRFKERYPSLVIDEAFLHESVDYFSFAGRLISRLTRGAGMLLPNGLSMTGVDGYTRRFFRVKFWEQNPQTYGDIEFQPDRLPPEVASIPLSEQEKSGLPHYMPTRRPLFFGHYWQEGVPAPITPNVGGLDYSAVKQGRLAAYRMDGEQQLSKEKYVWVDGIEPRPFLAAN